MNNQTDPEIIKISGQIMGEMTMIIFLYSFAFLINNTDV